MSLFAPLFQEVSWELEPQDICGFALGGPLGTRTQASLGLRPARAWSLGLGCSCPQVSLAKPLILRALGYSSVQGVLGLGDLMSELMLWDVLCGFPAFPLLSASCQGLCNDL